MSYEWMNVLGPAAVKGTALLAAAGVAAAALRRRSAAERHLVWTLALVALLVLPALLVALPSWESPSVPRLPVVAPAAPAPVPESTAPAGVDGNRMLVAIWAAGALALLFDLSLGWLRLWWIAARARDVSGNWRGLALSGCRARILTSPRCKAPLAWGRTILVPAGAGAWPEERRRAVLLHELAHIERRDWATQLVAQLARAVYWFHPLVWLAARQMRIERERACDDRVLSTGTPAHEYATHLVAVARSLAPRTQAASAMASHLESRLAAILDPERRRGGIRRHVLAAALAGTALLTVPLAAMRPQAAPPPLTLSGTVYDPSGAVVPGARVSIFNARTEPTPGSAMFHTELSAVTSEAGAYVFPPLRPGTYTLIVEKPGFAVFLRRGVRIESGRPVKLDAMLQVGQVAEEVSVVSKREGPPPAPVTAPQRVRVGGNVQPPKMLRSAQPGYPGGARKRGAEGSVVLRAVIWMDGSIGGLQTVSSPDGELTAAAINAVRQWRYEPTLLNGQPVEVETTITVNFRLEP